MLTAQTTHRQTQRLRNRLGLGISAVSSQVGQLDVQRRAHASAKVRRARCHDTVVVGHSKLKTLDAVHNVESALQAVKHLVQDGALLHAHNAQVVLLADPDDEALVLGDVHTTAVRPVLRDARRKQVAVRRHVLECDVRVHQSLVLRLVDEVRVARSEGAVLATVLGHGNQVLERLQHEVLHVAAVLLRHRSRQRERLEVAADTHAHRQLRQTECRDVQNAALRQALHTLERPVVDVLGILADLVVLRQCLAEERLEAVVVSRLAGIASHARVWVLNATVAALEQISLVCIVQCRVVLRVEDCSADVVRVVRLDSHYCRKLHRQALLEDDLLANDSGHTLDELVCQLDLSDTEDLRCGNLEDAAVSDTS